MSINATLIGQMITFTLLVWFTMKHIWPPIMQALEERKEKIAEGLAAAERGHHSIELAEKRAKELLKEAKGQASEIVTLAQKRANEVVEESKQTARIEGERIISAAQAEIEHERQQAGDALREQVSVLALVAAEKILHKEIDKNAHKKMLDDVSRQLGEVA